MGGSTHKSSSVYKLLTNMTAGSACTPSGRLKKCKWNSGEKTGAGLWTKTGFS